MVTSIGLPHNRVNDVFVQRPFLCLDRTATLPSPRTVRNRILNRVHIIEGQILDKLPFGTKVSLALNSWSPHDMSSYMGIIAYWIDEDWNYRNACIGFEWIHGSHTGERLADILAGVIHSHSLKDRIYTITSDSAGNMGTLFASLIKSYRSKHKRVKIISVTTSAEHVPCLAHVIQLALKDLLGGIKANPTNKELQAHWNNREDGSLPSPEKSLPMTLAKVKNPRFLVIFLAI